MNNKDDMSIDKGDLIDVFSDMIAEKKNSNKEKIDFVIEETKDTVSKTPAHLNVSENQIEQKSTNIEKIDFQKEQNITELIILVNEISNVLKSELKNFVNEKLIDNMLLRSLEKMALQSFLFKNSNWDAEGNLRTDGTIDVERVIKNFSGYKNELERIEKEIEDSLFMLMSFRLKAIKAVFEKDKYENFLAAFINKKDVIEHGYKKPIINFFNEKIFNKVIKGDE